MQKKTHLFFICLLLFLIITPSTLLIILAFKGVTPYVAFYNIEEPVQKEILAILNQEQIEKTKNTYKEIVLNADIPLSAQKDELKKCDLVFAQLDYDFIDFCKTSSKLKKDSLEFIRGMSSNIVNTVPIKDKRLCYVPVLYDFYQIDVDYNAFKKFSDSQKTKTIDYWRDLAEFLSFETHERNVPLVFAGQDKKNLLALTGMLAEALYEPEPTSGSPNPADKAPKKYQDFSDELYEAFKKDFYEQNAHNYENLRAIMDQACAPQGILYNAINEFASLMNTSKTSSNVFKFSQQEMNFYLENSLSSTALLRLSDHRTIDRSAINHFSSIYCPSAQDRSIRKFAAPCICVTSLKNNRQTRKMISLVSNSSQTELSTKTGLCPVQKNCAVADRQADDVRYWIAASDGPMIPLYAAVPSKAAADFCADFIIDKITGLLKN